MAEERLGSLGGGRWNLLTSEVELSVDCVATDGIEFFKCGCSLMVPCVDLAVTGSHWLHNETVPIIAVFVVIGNTPL